MGDLEFTIKCGSGTYTKLDKEYNSYINNVVKLLDEDKIARWDFYNLFMNELINLGLKTIFEEVKYRLTDGEDANKLILEIINREDQLSEISWFLKAKIELFIDEDFYNKFY